jgi:SnoaL-like protein
MRRICVCFSLLLLLACGRRTRDGEKQLNAAAFREMMNRLADGWSQQKTDQALACFNEDAIYMEPPDIQFYKGHSQLRPYFSALKPGTFMRFHNLWFDEVRQIGAGEYSFDEVNEPTADHGVVVVELRDGRIAFWREYQQKGPTSFERFLDTKDKRWRWTIENYP